jgi:NAD(P)-dependent dehydrogenase (short-subunit alcohol dehydrogenase family)
MILTGRRHERLNDVVSRCTSAYGVAGDIRDDNVRQQCVDAAVERFGRIDGLVNNAGVLNALPALLESADDIRAMLEINLVAPMDLARRCAAVMRMGGGGSIVNVTSMSALVATGATVPSAGYCAAKAGLAHATRELAVQWGRYGIRVNAVAPGMFPTEMIGEVSEPPDFFMDRLVLKRAGTAAEIVGTVRFLLSGASAYITGQHLAVDGGRTIT